MINTGSSLSKRIRRTSLALHEICKTEHLMLTWYELILRTRFLISEKSTVNLCSNLVVSKSVTEIMTKKMTMLKQNSRINEQYARYECLQISGLLSSTKDQLLFWNFWENGCNCTRFWSRNIASWEFITEEHFKGLSWYHS